jgi:hypothetical protein
MHRQLLLGLVVVIPMVCASPGSAQAQPKQPGLRIDLEGVQADKFFSARQGELHPRDRGWGQNDEIEFKHGNRPWYRLKRPTIRQLDGELSVISTTIYHQNGLYRSDEIKLAITVKCVKVNNRDKVEVISSELGVELRHENSSVKWKRLEARQRAGAYAGKEWNESLAVLKEFSSWLPDNTKHPGHLQLNSVVDICATILLRNTLHPHDQNPIHAHDAVTAEGPVYAISRTTDGMTRHAVPSTSTFIYYGFRVPQVRVISTAELWSIPEGPSIPSHSFGDPKFPRGRLVQGRGHPSIFLLEEGKRRGIPDPHTFVTLGFDGKDVYVISPEEIDQIPPGNSLPAIQPPPSPPPAARPPAPPRHQLGGRP